MQTEIGVVYNPIMEELYVARAGQGAFCNGTKLQVTHLEGMVKYGTEYHTELFSTCSNVVITFISTLHS